MDAEEQKTRVTTGNEIHLGARCTQCGLTLARGATVCPNDGHKVGPDLSAGSRIAGKYTFVEVLGQGGMSAVYKAEDPMLKRTVAVKLLNQQFAADELMLKRFRQEGRAISQLNHPNIVRVHEFTMLEHGQPCIVMDFIPGQSLADAIRQQGGLPVAEALSICRQVAGALDHAHSRGILHRDLKPSNVMIEKSPEGKWRATLVDFGIAKIAEGAADSGRLTNTGELVGSPMYMSPEQCRGLQVDARSDLYSLGCLMYETLSGKTVFDFKNQIEIVFKQINNVPAPLAEVCPDGLIPQGLQDIVEKLLAKQPEDRFASASQLLDVIDRLDVTSPVASRRARSKPFAPVPMVLGLACVVALAGIFAATKLWPYGASSVVPSHQQPFTTNTDYLLSMSWANMLNEDHLDLTRRDVTNAGLKSIARLQHLKKLVLNQTPVSDLSPLAANTALQELSVAQTKIKDDSLRAVNKLGLSSIDFSDDDITDKGMAMLAHTTSLAYVGGARTKLTDSSAPFFAALPELDSVELRGTKIGDGVLAALSSSMKWLNIEDTAVTDSGMASISRFRGLKGLYLGDSNITDAGLAGIAKIPGLSDLSTNSRSITDAGAKAITGMTSLSDLDLDYTGITDGAGVWLSRLKHLQTLEVSHSQIGDKGIADLGEMPMLETLNLSDCTNVTDHSLDAIARQPSITNLILARTGVTGDGLMKLKAAKTLSELHIQGIRLTASQLKELQTALPRCQILTGP